MRIDWGGNRKFRILDTEGYPLGTFTRVDIDTTCSLLSLPNNSAGVSAGGVVEVFGRLTANADGTARITSD